MGMDKRRRDRTSSLTRYLNDIRAFPLLTREQEHEKALRMRRGNSNSSHDELVESNLRFVVKIAGEYRNRGLPFEDLLNEGNIGLIEAVRRFDPARGTKFLTYAVWWIRHYIQKALAAQSAIVHIPRNQLKSARDLRNTRKMMSRDLGRQPDREEMSKELRLSIAKIDRLLMTDIQEFSLDDGLGSETDGKLSDRLTDDRSIGPEAELMREERQGLVCRLLGSLGEKDRSVLVHYYGLEGGRALTFREIGEKLGITCEGVRQIEVRARERLRRLIVKHQRGSAGHEPYLGPRAVIQRQPNVAGLRGRDTNAYRRSAIGEPASEIAPAVSAEIT